MIRFFLILSLLLLNFEKVWSEEGLSRQEKNLLSSIEKVDKKNEVLGEELTKEDCKGIKTKGSPRPFQKDFLWCMLEEECTELLNELL